MSGLHIPIELLDEMQLSPEELRIAIAVYLYDQERLSIGRAKKLAGLTQIAFQQELTKRGVHIKYDIGDLEKDLSNLQNL